MRLLIIEDNEPLAKLTAALLESADGEAKRFEGITLAGDLESALAQLASHDAVLCDGRFPLAPTSPVEVEEWDVVHHEAQRHGKRFVLYTGSPRALARAEEIGAAALPKPALLEEIYDALTSELEADQDAAERLAEALEAVGLPQGSC